MIAAIYARYSSHLQREESIADQVAACRAEGFMRGSGGYTMAMKKRG